MRKGKERSKFRNTCNISKNISFDEMQLESLRGKDTKCILLKGCKLSCHPIVIGGIPCKNCTTIQEFDSNGFHRRIVCFAGSGIQQEPSSRGKTFAPGNKGWDQNGIRRSTNVTYTNK